MTMLDVTWSRSEQPITWRLNRSFTTASNSQLSSVALYVMSPTQTLSGSTPVNSRLSRLSKIGNLWLLWEVTFKRRLLLVRMPCGSMRCCTRFLPTGILRATRSHQVRGRFSPHGRRGLKRVLMGSETSMY